MGKNFCTQTNICAIMATSPDSQIDDPVFDADYLISPPYTNTTPSSELSPPDSPASKNAALAQDKRGNARRLAASLSLEEQVSLTAPCSLQSSSSKLRRELMTSF